MAKLKFSQSGREQKVELDGEDISRLIRGLSLDAVPGEPPRINLDILVFEVETDTEDASIHLAPGAADMLALLGWTPPHGRDI